MFPERGASTLKAKAMCAACMVNLEFALTEVEHFGLWGGLPERELRRIRGQRIRAAKARLVS